MIYDIPSFSFKCLTTSPKGQIVPPDFSKAACGQALRFHRRIPGYAPTPLVRLRELARFWGVSEVLVKDESSRFGLGAFKALGGSYAVARVLCRKLGVDIGDMDFHDLAGDAARRRIGRMTFATATDGNHGRGLAWAAEQLGHSAVIFMPKGAAPARVASIRSHGATVEQTDLNYDDAVRLCRRKARENGWCVVQDTAWEGYADIPRWIMQGYTTLCMEAAGQLTHMAIHPPTHVLVQAGVGGFAASVIGCLMTLFLDPPRFIVVEPNNAACIFASAKAGDGSPHAVSGDLDSIMSGLSCGEPNPLAWEILQDLASSYIRCADFVAANGVRILAHPLGGDAAIEAGESGAVGIGVVDLLMRQPRFQAVKQALGLGPDARVLAFNTEGATDPDACRDILWYGKHPSVPLSHA